MQSALVCNSSALGLGSRARISRSFKTSPARSVRVCRFSKGPVAFKEDDSLMDKAKSVAKGVQSNLPQPPSQIDIPNGADLQSATQHSGERIYKAVEDEEFDGPLRVFPAFTRRREHTVGRLAMLGCAAAWAGEVLTGAGPMQQYANALSVPYGVTFWATIFLAAAHLISGLSTESPTQSAANKRDIDRRVKGITGNQYIEPDANQKATSIWQQLLRTELALGRSAMLIFLGVMLVENVLGGESPLAHFGLIQAGVPLTMAPAWLKLNIALFTAGGIGVFSLFDQNKDPEAY